MRAWCIKAPAWPNFSGSAPLLMLDNNAAVEEEVHSSFKPYDRDVNFTVLGARCARHNLDVPDDEAIAVVQHVDRFTCDP